MELLRFTESKGLVKKNDDGATYSITQPGKELLPKLNQAFMPLYREHMEPFLERKR